MDYKKFFKSRKLRLAILECLRFIPDPLMLKIQYKIKTGRRLSLKNPKRFTEKLQWYKMYYRNPIMHQCVDKYLVREFIKEKGLEEILVPLYAKYDSINDLDIDSLPEQFVIKTTSGGGGLNVILCSDKSEFDKKGWKEQLTCKTVKTKTGGREWAYYGLKPGIVVEKLLINRENPKAGIKDYKFFCYNGKVKYVIVDVDRYIGHKRNLYDREWKRINCESDCPSIAEEEKKPKNFERMLEIAEKLSKDFPYVRVDLYNIEGKIYFGELTFYPWSGYVQFEPDEIDFLLGEDFELKTYKN